MKNKVSPQKAKEILHDGTIKGKNIISKQRRYFGAMFHAKNGIIQDDNGYWDPKNVGKVVKINSNDITMQGVNQPLLGISNTGHTQLMQPNKNYKFRGKNVTEYPIAQNGLSTIVPNNYGMYSGIVGDKGPQSNPTQLEAIHNMIQYMKHNTPDSNVYRPEFMHHSVNKFAPPTIAKNGQNLEDLTNFTNYNMEQAKLGIHINPANKGKFNALKKKTGKSTEELTHSKNPLTRKRAIFAQNAKKWHHGEDGILIAQDGNSIPANDNPYMWNTPGINGYPSMPQNPNNQGLIDISGQTGYNPNAHPITSLTNDKQGLFGKLGGIQGAFGIASGIAKGISSIANERKMRNRAEQDSNVTGVIAQAATTRPEQVRHRWVRPEDMITDPNQLSPSYGVGTNYLAEDGAYIKGQSGLNMNNYLYNSSEEPISMLGGAIGNGIRGGGFHSNGGGQIGSTLGGAAGSLIGGPIGGFIGKGLGSLVGGLLDKNPAEIKRFQKQTNANEDAIQGNAFSNQLQYSNNAYMEYGGNVFPKMNSNFYPARTGGNIRQNNMTYDDGGIMTHWGGKAAPQSQNPYMPGDGTSVMFRGNSHDETDNKGNSGIGVTYGNNSVEVEGGEPASKLQDGGLVVYGNLPISKESAAHIGDPKASGRKFKNYVSDLNKNENKQNTTLNKSLKVINTEDTDTPFDTLKFNSAKANFTGANMRLQDIATKKQNAAVVQDAINQTAKEHGIVADDLAKGKITQDKKAKYGAYLAQSDGKINNATEGKPAHSIPQADGTTLMVYSDGTGYIDSLDGKTRTYYNSSGQPTATHKGFNTSGSYQHSMDVIPSYPQEDPSNPATLAPGKKNKFDYISAVTNQIVPYLRHSNQLPLDPSQISGELYSLATNQVEPVQAQLFHPQLNSPYDISLQDQLNANQSDFNAIRRDVSGNPAALSTLAGQKYSANSNVLGNQFRMNQGEKAQVYDQNRKTLDQAQLTNLGILGQQYERQSLAKSKTKAEAINALNSISSKIAQNKLENKTLGIYENLYNYRYDNQGRAINENGLATFNIPYVGDGSENASEIPNRLIPSQDKKKKARNGSIVKSLKTI